ncbi:ABC transporter substrate-binding protein [Ramlibacter sp.]|uniref:ABC transporter substrate-binding protein n=1 Tax=Ramlibacter sp. TaxID=1917967 RepID=UPI003D106EC2
MRKAAARLLGGLAVMAAACGASAQATQGISRDEIVLGTILDLSGPIAWAGKQSLNGQRMRIEEINAAGGINGRKIKLLAEDDAYDPKRSVLAAQKLVNNEKVFAIVQHIGTAGNVATQQIKFDRNVVNFMPATGARSMFEPPDRLKVALQVATVDAMEAGVRQLVGQSKHTRVCAVHQDDEFGMEYVRGTEAGLKAMNLALAERASFKRGTTDFSSQAARLKAANCQLVVIGAPVREAVGIIKESRKLDFNPEFLGGDATYNKDMIALDPKAVEGVYCAHFMLSPAADSKNKRMRDWFAAYKAKFGEDPGQSSIYGYYAIDVLAAAAAKAGANLTTDSFLTALETNRFPHPFDGPEFYITKANRLGIHEFILSKVDKGQWTPLVTGIKAPR